MGRLSGGGGLAELAARSSPNRYQGRREVAEQIAEMDLRIRLVGDKGAVEGGEGEAREVVGVSAPRSMTASRTPSLESK